LTGTVFCSIIAAAPGPAGPLITMSDSLPASAGGRAADDREARIEQLLLSGLDQYFEGHYQQAINIWTRVVFLERGHSRARAYIERARSAMAERQRLGEELVYNGITAYHAGDVETARDLLTKAVEKEVRAIRHFCSSIGSIR
jgi:hypothetical protein